MYVELYTTHRVWSAYSCAYDVYLVGQPSGVSTYRQQMSKGLDSVPGSDEIREALEATANETEVAKRKGYTHAHECTDRQNKQTDGRTAKWTNT